MKILMTGAHFTPAVAVAEELRKYSNTKIIYVGRNKTLEGDNSKSVESQILPKFGIKFIPIITGRLQRSFTIYTLPSLFKLPIGLIQAFYIVLREKPDLILSFGGYVAVPVVFIGWLFSIPILIHEQTLVSGLANKISSYFASKIALSFNQGQKFSEKVIVTGNPIRRGVLNPITEMASEFQQLFKNARKQKLPVVLITGGNQGSHLLNISIEKIIDKLTKYSYVIHITGESKFQDFERLEKLQNDHFIVRKWIGEEWGAILSKIDLVVSRAGINTLTEIAYMGKPALVIPIPYLYQDEQVVNANFFEKLGMVQILPQSRLSGEVLLKHIKLMFSDLDNLTKKAKGLKSVVLTNGAKRLALEAVILSNKDNEKKV